MECTGDDRWVPSTCQGCLTNCAVLVHVRDGRAVEVVGNPESAANHGRVCSNVHIALQQLYDPDRVATPLRRTNPRKGRGEDPGFVPVSWDEALDEIAERLVDLRNRGEGYKLAVAKGRSTRIGDVLHKALPDIFGTPNRFTHASICAEAEKLATGCLDGHWDYHDYDLENSRFVLLWGTDPLSSNRQKTHVASLFSKLKTHARIVAVDPRRSLTASRAHAWLPVVPGTDGALACAMAHVILSEGLWNRGFAGDFADGRNRFAEGGHVDGRLFLERGTLGLVEWWNCELHAATPEWAAGECGIAVDEIRELARSFAKAGSRAVSWVSPGVAMSARGLYGAMAAYALNGLVGSVGSEGGVLQFPRIPSGKLPDTAPFQDDVARAALCQLPADQRGTRHLLAGLAGRAHKNQVTNRIADAVLQEDPYRIEVLIAYWCNWAFSCTGAQRWEQALAALPFFVHLTTHVSEMSCFADIVLPARHHMFEAWGLANGRQNLHACVSIEQPSVAPLPGTKNEEADFPFDLACKLRDRGFPNLYDYYASFTDPVTGAHPSCGDDLAECAVKLLSQPLWENAADAPACGHGPSRKEAWQRFVQVGVWSGPRAEVPAPSGFQTPTGLFEFRSAALEQMLGEHASAFGTDIDGSMALLGYEAAGQRCFFPHYEHPVRYGDAASFPFVFSQHRAFASLEGRAANTPLFQKRKRIDPGDEAWDDVIKVHPHDVAALGLTDGQMVRVVSVQGEITVRLKTWDGTRPGVVVKCYGQGHWAYGHVAALDFEHAVPRGGNNNEIIPAEWERISASTARHGGLARVRLEPCLQE